MLGSPLLAPGAAHRLLLLDVALVVRLPTGRARRHDGRGLHVGGVRPQQLEAARTPLAREVAFTSVFSRRDGIIDWRGCLDPQAETVEVRTSHLGMAFDPVVLDVVARNPRRRSRGAGAGRSAGRPAWRKFRTRRRVSPAPRSR